MGQERKNRPLLSDRYRTTETKTDSLWVDDRPVFRRVVAIAGGAQNSSVTVAALANLIGTIVSASWSVLDGTTFLANRAAPLVAATELTETGVEIIEATGAITVYHSNFDLTGDTVYLVLEYTKQ